MKIFDCSNSSERPIHRTNSYGPKENSIVSGLKEFAGFYNCEFVNNLNDCDLIFTNDVFTKEALNDNKPMVKRMDGIFWQKNLQNRNELLNASAVLADHVIFISEFSRKSFFTLFNLPLKQHSTILNRADNRIFYPNKKMRDEKFAFAVGASNWSREEKRLNLIVEFAKRIENNIYLIGECEEDLPENILKFGYIHYPPQIAEVLWRSHAFVNFSYKDAAPMMVCQASACGLPVLYGDSGGLIEVAFCGVGIHENSNIAFEDKVADLSIDKIMEAYGFFKREYEHLDNISNAYYFNYMDTMKEYFDVFKKFA